VLTHPLLLPRRKTKALAKGEKVPRQKGEGGEGGVTEKKIRDGAAKSGWDAESSSPGGGGFIYAYLGDIMRRAQSTGVSKCRWEDTIEEDL